MMPTQALHRALLAGTSRAPLDPAGAVPAELRALMAAAGKDGNRGNHGALWHAVAAADLWQRAGFEPTRAHLPPPQPAPADHRDQACPRAAERILQQLLLGVHAELLESWLHLARAAHVCLPHAALAPLLELGMTRPALRDAIVPVLGARGHWLAAQHPQWSARYGIATAASGSGASGASDLSGAAPEAQWQLGGLRQCCDALTAMRRTDPAAALAALRADWAQEPPEHRAALLPCLATGLRPDDEPFLEQALDDKRKEVRAGARQLLAALPGSALVARCKARLAPLLTLERKTGLGARLGALLGGGSLPTLNVMLPDACDKAMKRDGIGVQSHYQVGGQADQQVGERAGSLLDLVASVPPAHWSDAWQLAPAQVVAVMAAQEFHQALLAGLVLASAHALLNGADATAVPWLATLLEDRDGTLTRLGVRTGALMPHLALMPRDAQEQLALQWLASGRQALAFDWAGQLAQAGRTLSPELSRKMLAALRRTLLEPANTNSANYQARHHLSILARALDTGTLAEAEADAGWPAADWPQWPHWREPVDRFLGTLQFRHAMHTSFLETHA